MDGWHEFLDSLATAGGNIFVLFCMWLISGGTVMSIIKHGTGLEAEVRSAIRDVFMGINGAILFAITQRQKVSPVVQKDDPNVSKGQV